MPSLKEIYDDSIRIVKEDPRKIGAHFWLAFTAYRLMQDPNNDGKDFAYRDVGVINFSYQSDSAYQKAMRVYGDEMTLERMQDPSLFWKLYDLFVEDPDLESVNDIRANDRRVYNRKAADLEDEITDITDQNTELNKQIRAINESTPEKQQLISRSNDLLDQRFDKQKAIQTLAAEQAQRSIALAIADEKNGSIGVASRKQIDETLAELKQDPYFETRLYLESEKGIDKIIDDPAKFIQDYRIEKGIYDELAQLRDKKDYKGLIDRFEQLIESDNDPNVSLYLNAINACIEQKIPNIGVHKEFDNDTKEFITGLSEEFARRTANNSVAVRRAENEMRNRIRSGEFP